MIKSRSLKPLHLTAYVLIPLAVACFFILKIFFFPGCFAFDSNDDASYPFSNLFVAREIMRAGEIPMINLFNNFGMPMIGDCLTFPYAPHSLTYLLFPDYIAMTLNRFIFTFLTVLVLSIYYKKYMTIGSASVCSILTITTPGFLQHLAHHQYQSILFLFTLMLFSS